MEFPSCSMDQGWDSNLHKHHDGLQQMTVRARSSGGTFLHRCYVEEESLPRGLEQLK